MIKFLTPCACGNMFKYESALATTLVKDAVIVCPACGSEKKLQSTWTIEIESFEGFQENINNTYLKTKK